PNGPPTGGAITGNQPGPGGGAITGSPPPQPGRPARRQEASQVPPTGAMGFEMKMADLMAMAENKKNGGTMATWEMMTNFVAQQKSAEQQKEMTKRRRSFPVRRRLGGVHF
ncbi:hypothetical protein N0V92_011115, partial [Colletotrichum tropicale]